MDIAYFSFEVKLLVYEIDAVEVVTKDEAVGLGIFRAGGSSSVCRSQIGGLMALEAWLLRGTNPSINAVDVTNLIT